MWIDPDIIVDAVEAYYGNRFKVVSFQQSKTARRARKITFFLAKAHSKMSEAELSLEFDTNRSQIYRGAKQVQTNYSEYAKDIEQILQTIFADERMAV